MRADKAIELFTHYFQTAFEGAGVSWGCDNDTEIEIAVQNIVEAATPDPDTATIVARRERDDLRELLRIVTKRLVGGRDGKITLEKLRRAFPHQYNHLDAALGLESGE